MLEVGIKHIEKTKVDNTNTAAAVGSGGLDVYSTPAMIGLMEMTCKICAQEYLEDGLGTVGISVSIKHKAATPIGMEVRCECELVEIDRSRLVFKVKCYDELDEIGEGIHERFIIENDKFLANVNAKIEKAKKK